MTLKLFIGNKNYSSWSMRPWVLMKEARIEFEEVRLRLDSFQADSNFKKALISVNPAGKVPVLLDEDFAVWDSLAIAEYLAEKFPDRQLWPSAAQARARARSVCAEMHAGFAQLRSHMNMNIEAHLPEVGERILRENPGVRSDVDRINSLWSELLQTHGGPMLFGQFSIADAYFAPVVMRFKTFAVPTPALVTDYMNRVSALPSVAAWVAGALAEKDFLAPEEPYRRR